MNEAKRRIFPALICLLACVLIGMGATLPVAHAHDLPLSYLDLRPDIKGVEVVLEASARDFSRELPAVKEAVLLTPTGAQSQKNRLAALVFARLHLIAPGAQVLRAELKSIEPLPEREDVRLRLRYDWPNQQMPDILRVQCRLFPRDPRHKTFLTLYRGETLQRQEIFDDGTTRLDLSLGGDAVQQQNLWAVVGQFVREGVHHIFIGPDHILFIVGLMLLGGTLKGLLKIVTAFTLAHSLTLTLATLNIWNPPPRVVEPLIALSIVFVGAHGLYYLAKKPISQATAPRDWRLLLAFGFGFIHGFGFAGVLRELELPRHALGWSLFGFNAGVELGQACIVLAVVPLLALLRRHNRVLAQRVVVAGSLSVIAAGAFWFVQRVWFDA